MALTHQSVIRDRMLLVLLDEPAHRARTRTVINAIDDRWNHAWTTEDISPVPSRPTELNWVNRAMWERINLIKDGLFQPKIESGHGLWALTLLGVSSAQSLGAAGAGDPVDPTLEPEPPFLLTSADTETKAYMRPVRPNQQRFAFDVFERYGWVCAVCGIDIGQIVQAAHVKPKMSQGSDDARNGLPLCANHHLAYDAGMWAIEPGSTKLHARPNGPTLVDLGIVADDLSHLAELPHVGALDYRWELWGGPLT